MLDSAVALSGREGLNDSPAEDKEYHDELSQLSASDIACAEVPEPKPVQATPTSAAATVVK